MVGRYFGSRELSKSDATEGRADRKFGYALAGFFTLIGCVDFYVHHARGPWWVALALVFFAAALARPAILGPLNRLRLKFLLLLCAIISAFFLALLFYLCITPIGLIMRLAGKDLLNLRSDPRAESYWVQRRPPGPAAKSFKNQY